MANYNNQKFAIWNSGNNWKWTNKKEENSKHYLLIKSKLEINFLLKSRSVMLSYQW